MNSVKESAIKMLRSRQVSSRDAIMFDIDDTLFNPRTGQPIGAMIELLHVAFVFGYRVILITARPKIYENFTRDQLLKFGISFYELYHSDPINKSFLKSRLPYNFILSVGDKYTDLGNSKYWIKLPTDSIGYKIFSNLDIVS